MIVAQVIFGARGRNKPDELEDLAERYLAMLFRPGQIFGEYLLAWTKGVLNAYVRLTGRGAWALRYHSKYARQELEKVAEVFGKRPVWKMLSDDARQSSSSWKGAPFLYLFTHAFELGSPVCRGDGKPPIPVFALPLSFAQKEQVYFWQRSYYHHEHVWLDSGALEVAAYRQLADPNSQLARKGRDLCRQIERATGVPTYYYLTRFWGRLMGEEERPCPGCGGRWKAARPPKKPARARHFDFKCDRCRLVSNVGDSTGGGRQTRIGEFQGTKKAKPAPRTGVRRRSLH